MRLTAKGRQISLAAFFYIMRFRVFCEERSILSKASYLYSSYSLSSDASV